MSKPKDIADLIIEVMGENLEGVEKVFEKYINELLKSCSDYKGMYDILNEMYGRLRQEYGVDGKFVDSLEDAVKILRLMEFEYFYCKD